MWYQVGKVAEHSYDVCVCTVVLGGAGMLMRWGWMGRSESLVWAGLLDVLTRCLG